jgi:hypothetical protein
MKYLISMTIGMLTGAVAFLALLYYNPLLATTTLSPLSVTDNQLMTLNYSAVAEDSLMYTNDGESLVDPYPEKVLQLWEPPIRLTEALVTVLADGRQQPAGIGIKFMSDSEQTRLLHGEALVDSAWHIYLPGRGSLFVEQTENHWSFLREIVVPARWSNANSWRGTWHGNVTMGPGALGTARVVGGSGEFSGVESDAVESWSAKAYSVEQGPVAMTGQLNIEIPGVAGGGDRAPVE